MIENCDIQRKSSIKNVYLKNYTVTTRRMVGAWLLDGWGNGYAMFELSESRADVRPWAEQECVALHVAI